MGASGKYGWGGDRRSALFLQEYTQRLQERENARLKKREERNDLSDVLGERSSDNLFNYVYDAKSESEVRAEINPNYAYGTYEYTHNCALCSAAAILRYMGYDVEAMPRDSTWRGFTNVLKFDWRNYDNYISPGNGETYTTYNDGKNYNHENQWIVMNNPNKSSRSMEKNISLIENTMRRWGNNSIAELNVSWKGGGAHSVVVGNNNGNVFIVDSQTGRVYTNTSSYIGSFRQFFDGAVHSSVSLHRADNLSLRSDESAKKDLKMIVKRRVR